MANNDDFLKQFVGKLSQLDTAAKEKIITKLKNFYKSES